MHNKYHNFLTCPWLLKGDTIQGAVFGRTLGSEKTGESPAGKDTCGSRWGLTNGPHSGDGLVKTTLGVLSCWGLKILFVCFA